MSNSTEGPKGQGEGTDLVRKTTPGGIAINSSENAWKALEALGEESEAKASEEEAGTTALVRADNAEGAAVVIHSARHLNADLLSTLQGDGAANTKLAKAREYRENLSNTIKNKPFEEAVKLIIQWVTDIENTTDGLSILDELEHSDLFDLKNPAVVVGLMLYGSKNAMADGASLGLLHTMLDEQNGIMSEDDIEALLDNTAEVELAESEDAAGKKRLLYVGLARQLLKYTLDNGGQAVRVKDLDLEMLDLRVERPADVFEGLSDNAVAVFGAIQAQRPRLYEGLMQELMLNLRADHRREQEGKKKFGSNISGVEDFEDAVRNMISLDPDKVRGQIRKALDDLGSQTDVTRSRYVGLIAPAEEGGEAKKKAEEEPQELDGKLAYLDDLEGEDDGEKLEVQGFHEVGEEDDDLEDEDEADDEEDDDLEDEDEADDEEGEEDEERDD